MPSGNGRRVLLVNPPGELKAVMGCAGEFVTRSEPLGLLYLASVLLAEGFDVQVLDAEADSHTVEQILDVVQAYDPGVVGITCLTPTAPPAVELGRRLREGDGERTVVMGNVHARVFAETLLRIGACDFIVHGDGEFILLELLRCLESGGDPSRISGLSLLRDGRCVTSPPPPLPRDLDVIPPPARHLVKHLKYDAGTINNLTYVRPKGTVSKHAMTSRGCVFKCRFCVVHQERRFRVHSPKRVVDEILDLQENCECGFLFFIDPIFVANKRRVLAICEEMKRREVRIPWCCEGHVRMADREMLEAMKRAGCVNVAYGIESGSQRMLDRMGKQITLDAIDKAIDLTREVGIQTSGLFILGLPDETREDLERTIDLAMKLPLDLAQFSMFVPYPGSLDFEDLSSAGVIDTGVRRDGSIDFDVWRRYSPYVGYGTVGAGIYTPEEFSFDELFAAQRRAMRKFYLRPRLVLANLKRLRPSNVLGATRAAASMFFKRKTRKNERPPDLNPEVVSSLSRGEVIAAKSSAVEVQVSTERSVAHVRGAGSAVQSGSTSSIGEC